jgi:catechol 2,3-dioxygenase-like lactoylglutathione lyase family enzyme
MEKKQPAIAITSEPIRGTYRISPEQAVVHEAIIATAIQKALQQGWFNDFVSFDDSGGSLFRRGSEPKIYYRDKDGLRIQFLHGSFWAVIWSHV